MSDKPSTWSDEPPKEPGKYLVRNRNSGDCGEAVLRSDGLWGDEGVECCEAYMLLYYQFGPRIPTAEELVGLYAAAAELAEIKRVWGMGDTKGGA